jgi:hypothetical protein
MEIVFEGLALLVGAALGLAFSWLALSGVLTVMFERAGKMTARTSSLE